VAREPLCVPKVLTYAPKVGHAIHRNANGATPTIFHVDLVKLWLDIEHVGPHEGFDVPREATRVVFSASEEHATVLRKLPVIDDEQCVGHRQIVAVNPWQKMGGQGLGGDHEVIDGHDVAREPRHELTEISIASKYHVLGLHMALSSFDFARLSVGCRLGTTVLVDSDACLGCGPRKPNGIFQWVQVSATVIKQSAIETLGAGALGHRVGRQVRKLLLTIMGLKVLEFLLQFSGMAGLGGQVQVPGTQLAVNLMLVD